jgi:hypothetical protein
MFYLLDILSNIIFFVLLNHFNPDELLVLLSNLEYVQDIVVPLDSYDIDLNDIRLFFEMLFQCQDLSVQLLNGVYVNCMTVNGIIYTVHPDFILFLINLFIILENLL